MATENSADAKSFIARLGHGFLALIGATSAADFADKFQAAWQDFKTRLDALEKREAPAAFDDKPLTERIAAMEAQLKDAPTKANVEQWAAAAGSAKAVEAVASVGLQPAAIVPATPTGATATASTSEQFIADGEFEKAWAALPRDHQDKKDFASADRYAAFMRATHAGQVAVFQKEKK